MDPLSRIVLLGIALGLVPGAILFDWYEARAAKRKQARDLQRDLLVRRCLAGDALARFQRRAAESGVGRPAIVWRDDDRGAEAAGVVNGPEAA